MREVVILLVGLLAGAVLQTLTGLLTDWRAAKRAHADWKRE